MYPDFGMVFYVKVEVVLIFLEEILQNLQIVWKNNESLVQTNASKPYIYSNLLLYFQISTVLWRKMAETHREQHKTKENDKAKQYKTNQIKQNKGISKKHIKIKIEQD